MFALGPVTAIILGCGGMIGSEPSKTSTMLETEKKVESLAKQGKSLREIRAIMKGEPLSTPKKGKKSARKH
jgi:hypothetical protein